MPPSGDAGGSRRVRGAVASPLWLLVALPLLLLSLLAFFNRGSLAVGAPAAHALRFAAAAAGAGAPVAAKESPPLPATSTASRSAAGTPAASASPAAAPVSPSAAPASPSAAPASPSAAASPSPSAAAATPSTSPTPTSTAHPTGTRVPPSSTPWPSHGGGTGKAAEPVPLTRSLCSATGALNHHAGTALWVRSYSGDEAWLTNVLLPSLRLFWPRRRFGRVYVVLDADSPGDVSFAGRLLDRFGGEELLQSADGAWQLGRVVTLPPAAAPAGQQPGDAENHLTSPLVTITYAKRLIGMNGYHTQQFDTMVADTHVPAAFPGAHPDEPLNDVIGVVDGDALLVTMPHDHAYFDEEGRPVVMPRVGLPFGGLWEQSALATEFILGRPEPFRGMSYFPVYVKRAHLVAMRAHIEATHNVSFQAAFVRMVGRGYYSQFNIIVSYLWHFHRDAYRWHMWMPDQDNGRPLDRERLRTSNAPGVGRDWAFLDDAEMTAPYPRTIVHWKHHKSKAPQRSHLVKGFCWSTRGAPGLCGRNPDWNGTWQHKTYQWDMWDFEYSMRGGADVVAASQAYYAQVNADVDARCWNVPAMEAHLEALDVRMMP